MNSVETFSPQRIAEILGLPEPTHEQAEVISSGQGAHLVVAGAGAGKTETMSLRAVWLVANGKVRPEEILGLTFTRKAAAELKERIRKHLTHFAAALDPEHPLRADLQDISPTVSTYDAYAGDLLKEYGLLLPVELSGRIIDDAEKFVIAYNIVNDWPTALSSDHTVKSIAENLIKLSEEMDNHLVSIEEVKDSTQEIIKDFLSRSLGLEGGNRSYATTMAFAEKFIDIQTQRVELLDLVQRYRQTLKDNRLRTFGQQMSFAAQIAQQSPVMGESQRDRYRAILFDEYQDTGYAQHVLLSSLYGHGHSGNHYITAVGDPMQSIYAFRGAAATNMFLFPYHFMDEQDQNPRDFLTLSTSWRNPTRVLELANDIVNWSTRKVKDRELLPPQLDSRSDASAGHIELSWWETQEQEAHWVASNFADDYEKYQDNLKDYNSNPEGKTPPTFSAAILVNKWAQAIPFARALQERNVDYVIEQSQSLLDTPEVSEVISYLKILHDPAEDLHVIKILAGPRWQLGAKDLVALAAMVTDLRFANAPRTSESDMPDFAHITKQEIIDVINGKIDEIVPSVTSSADKYTYVDALEKFAYKSEYRISQETFQAKFGGSQEGYQRLVEFAQELHSMRRASSTKTLPALVAFILHATGVNLETMLYKDSQDGILATRNLEQFLDVVHTFGNIQDSQLGSLLAYLDVVQQTPRSLTQAEAPQREGVVQILTVHAAKGLEWDSVAVPGVSRDIYNDRENASPETAWNATYATIPDTLRGDSLLPQQWNIDEKYSDALTKNDVFEFFSRPHHDVSEIEYNEDFGRSQHNYRIYLEKKLKQKLKNSEAEETDRVFYVAVTRAAHKLLISGFALGEGKTKGHDQAVLLTQSQRSVEKMLQSHGTSLDPMTDFLNIAHWAEVRQFFESKGGIKAYNDDLTEVVYKGKERTEIQEVYLPDTPESLEKQISAAEMLLDSRAEQPTEQDEFWPKHTSPQRQSVLDRATASYENSDSLTSTADPVKKSLASEEDLWIEQAKILAEEHRQSSNPDVTVTLPARLTASQAVNLAQDRTEFARNLRRPIPRKPQPNAKRGTAFHNWVEKYYDMATLDLDESNMEIPSQDPAQLTQLKENFMDSPWADRTPDAVEAAYSVNVAGHIFEGYIDAVFHKGDDPTQGWTIVDWKTHSRQPDKQKLKKMEMQLSIYRLAWAKLKSRELGVDIDPEDVRAEFYYVYLDQTYAPQHLLTQDELTSFLHDETD